MNACCFECGAPAEFDHHVVPFIRGGTKTVPLCIEHHGLVHDYEMSSVSALTKLAMQRLKERGLYAGGGVPYGYELQGHGQSLVPAPAEQLVIREAREMRAMGMTFRHIALELEQRSSVSRNGLPFSPGQIKRMVGPS